MTKNNQILHPFFIVCLLILILNDFCFKPAFANELTGKLSDFAGLIVFPIFISFLIPAAKKWITIITGVLFIVWKTPLVTPLIDTFNQIFPFKIRRIIDYSDYWALLVLPVAHLLLNQDKKINIGSGRILQLGKICIVTVSLFAICATSMPLAVEVPKGTIYIGKEYTIKKSKDETIEKIKSLGYNVDYYENLANSAAIRKYHTVRRSYYQTDNIIIYDENSNPVDTILNVKYTIYEPKEDRAKIEIINVTLSEEGNIQKWQTLKYLRKQYKKMVEKQVIKKLK